MSCRCPYRGDGYEADGRESSPEEIRDAIISEQGEWELVVSEPTAPKTCIAKSLRKKLKLSLAEAAALVHKMPGPLATGTSAEIHWLAHVLEVECGYRAAVRKVG